MSARDVIRYRLRGGAPCVGCRHDSRFHRLFEEPAGESFAMCEGHERGCMETGDRSGAECDCVDCDCGFFRGWDEGMEA